MMIRHIDRGGVPYSHATKTTATTTLYVRTTGNDANVGSSTSPLLTIQEAVNRVPEFLDHNFTIDVGAGTFANFRIMNKECGDGYLSVTGAMKTATVATGTATGTSTGGTTRTLTDSGQIWTVDDLKGKYVDVAGMSMFVIEKNTATTITLAGSGAWDTLSGKAYTIKDHATVVACTDNCWILNVNGGGGGGVEVKQMKFTSSTDKMFYTRYCTAGIAFTSCRFETTSASIACNNCENVGVYSCVATGAVGYGFSASNCNMVFLSQSLVYSCGSSYAYGGIDLAWAPLFWVDASVLGQGTNGHGVKASYSAGVITYLEASSNGGSGLYVDAHSFIRGNGLIPSNSVLHGTGNTRFGVAMEKDCLLVITGSTDITGTLGNYSFNNSYARTWATDFVSNGDIVVAEDTFSRVERVD